VRPTNHPILIVQLPAPITHPSPPVADGAHISERIDSIRERHRSDMITHNAFVRNAVVVGLVVLSLAGCQKPVTQTANRRFTWAIRNDLDTLDPALSTDAVSSDVLRQVFRGLTTIDAEGKVQPGLATKWTISKDLRIYDFEIDPAATFVSGALVTADAIKASFDRLRQPWAAGHLAADYASDIASFEIKSPQRVEFHLKQPRISFLFRLSHPSLAIVGPKAPKDHAISSGAEMDGAGPFAATSLVSGQELTLKARQPAGVDEVRILVMPDVNARINGFRTGSVDLALINSQDAKAFKGKPELHITPRSQLVYLQFNPATEPVLRDPRVRTALWQAFDRDHLVHDVQHDLHQIPTGFTGPGAPLSGTVKLPPFDPTAARRLLAEAGFPDGKGFPDLQVTYMDQGRENVAVDAIVTDWRTNLGIQAHGHAQDGKGLIEKNRKNAVAVFFTGWNGDYPDDDNFLPMLFRSTSPENHSGFADPAVDRLLTASDHEPDPTKRAALLQEAHARIAKALPILPLFITREPELLNPHWKNLPFGIFGHLDLSKLSQ
jgi:oligopeptide transport system substrate-binding protein